MMKDEQLHHHKRDVIALQPDVGFYAFNYGRVGTLAYQSFTRRNEQLELLEVNDCYCGGDAFVVYDHGQILNFVDNYCSPGSSDCSQYSRNAYYCYSYYGWCYGYMWLSPGSHNITIGTLNSPYFGGTGFIRLSKVCEKDGGFWSCCSFTNSCIQKVHYRGIEGHHQHHHSHSEDEDD